MGKLGIHSANISFQNLLSVFIMKSQLGESTTAGWMSQVPLCPDLHLGPVTAPSLQPHVNGTCCDCCWCRGQFNQQGCKVWHHFTLAFHRSAAELETTVMEVGWHICGQLSQSVAGGRLVLAFGDLSLTHTWAFSHHVLGVFLFLVVWGMTGSWQTSVVSPVLGSGIQCVPYTHHLGDPGGCWHQVGFGAQWDNEWHRVAQKATFLPW